MQIALDIADAVVTELNGAPAETFSQTFTAVRRVLALFASDDKAYRNLTVIVAPATIAIQEGVRGHGRYDVMIEVGVLKKMTTDDFDTEIEAMMAFVQEIVLYMRRLPLADQPEAKWLSTGNEPIYSPEHLHQARVFLSKIQLTYVVYL